MHGKLPSMGKMRRTKTLSNLDINTIGGMNLYKSIADEVIPEMEEEEL